MLQLHQLSVFASCFQHLEHLLTIFEGSIYYDDCLKQLKLTSQSLNALITFNRLTSQRVWLILQHDTPLCFLKELPITSLCIIVIRPISPAAHQWLMLRGDLVVNVDYHRNLSRVMQVLQSF